MPVEPLFERTRATLHASADPAFGEGQRRFFQHEVDSWGVRGPELKALARGIYRELKPWPAARRNRFCTALWKTGKLEGGALVCYVYRRFAAQCAASEFKLFESWIDHYVRNWAHCDGVSSWLLAACIGNDPSLIARLPPWTASNNRWKRRAAAVAMLQAAKQGRNTEAIFGIAARLMTDPDDMVQKGVGWLLKETYPKKPRETVKFLEPWRAAAPRLLLRYAAEKMTAADRAASLSRSSP